MPESYGFKSRLLRNTRISYWTAFESTNQQSGKTLLSGPAILYHSISLHHSLAITGSRHNGRVHHLPIGLHHGHEVHYQSLKMGCWRKMATVWSAVTADTSLHGQYSNAGDNCPLHHETYRLQLPIQIHQIHQIHQSGPPCGNGEEVDPSLTLVPKAPQWHKATSAQKGRLVVEEVRRQKGAERHTKQCQ